MNHHMPHIKAAETVLRERLLDYAEALLLEFWPEVRGAAVNEDELVAAGLRAERPDSDDYP